MRGRFGTPMNGIEQAPQKHKCKDCEYLTETDLCKATRKQKSASKARTCKYFKQKFVDAIASECKVYYTDGKDGE